MYVYVYVHVAAHVCVCVLVYMGQAGSRSLTQVQAVEVIEGSGGTAHDPHSTHHIHTPSQNRRRVTGTGPWRLAAGPQRTPHRCTCIHVHAWMP